MDTRHWTRENALALDQADSLQPFRDQFILPEGVIYLDGNSLGALPKATINRLQGVVTEEWGSGLIRSWNNAEWIRLPQRIGGKIARLIGAEEHEVIVSDSTSINLFKVLSTALSLNAGKKRILSEADNFPTDLYIAEGVCKQLDNRHELQLVTGDDDRIVAAIEANQAEIAVVMLTHVNYRTGHMHDMARITAAARAHGAIVIWDLAHSAGAVPVELNACDVDFAVGCGYKYLNGGPGAPAFLFVAERHLAQVSQPLSGWMGHVAPFDFVPKYLPAQGINRYLCSMPSIIAMAALEIGVEQLLAASMIEVRKKSLALTHLFIELVEQHCAGYGLQLVTPREQSLRGSQVSYTHPQGYPIMQALIARGVIGDFRAPDILRFGFTPLYIGYTDVWDAVMQWREIIASRAWDRPEFLAKQAVT
jgi:kynureninase